MLSLTEFKKPQLNKPIFMIFIYDIYDIAIVIEDLKDFCIIYIVTFWIILVNPNSKSNQN